MKPSKPGALSFLRFDINSSTSGGSKKELAGTFAIFNWLTEVNCDLFDLFRMLVANVYPLEAK